MGCVCTYHDRHAYRESYGLERKLYNLPQWFAHLEVSRDIFGCHSWRVRSCYWHLVGKVQGCCQNPTTHKTATHSHELPDPNCQWRRVEKLLSTSRSMKCQMPDVPIECLWTKQPETITCFWPCTPASLAPLLLVPRSVYLTLISPKGHISSYY